MTVPVSSTSACVSVLDESFKTLVQAVPLSFQSHVPEPGDTAVVGRTAHQSPPWVQTLDCGFSPVFAEIGRGSRVAQSSEPNSAAAAGAATGAAGTIARVAAISTACRTTNNPRGTDGHTDADDTIDGLPRRRSGALDRAGRRSCFDRVSGM